MRHLVVAAMAVGLAGCAFSGHPRFYPQWRAVASTRETPFQCGKATPVVVKTGKTGIGVTILFDGGDTTCTLAIDDVVLSVEGRDVAHAAPPPMPTLAPGVRVSMYFPLPFDENTSFNAGERHGALALRHGTESTTLPLELIEKGISQ